MACGLHLAYEAIWFCDLWARSTPCTGLSPLHCMQYVVQTWHCVSCTRHRGSVRGTQCMLHSAGPALHTGSDLVQIRLCHIQHVPYTGPPCHMHSEAWNRCTQHAGWTSCCMCCTQSWSQSAHRLPQGSSSDPWSWMSLQPLVQMISLVPLIPSASQTLHVGIKIHLRIKLK